MTWGWDARGALPAKAEPTTGVHTSGGGTGHDFATQAWPRYEAEYLKQALTSGYHKYNTDGLDSEQRQIYLDRVTAQYKAEADERLKAEFEQWLQGNHECNDPEADNQYRNEAGKPVRRWVFRNGNSKDPDGGFKVGQPREGWRHTYWARAPLTHLPGVREYLRKGEEAGEQMDRKLQLMAEFGPQTLEDSWYYFKHWVKGRPLSDAVPLPPRYTENVERPPAGDMLPDSMHRANPEAMDLQPGKLARDTVTSDVKATDTQAIMEAKALRGDLEREVQQEITDRAERQKQSFLYEGLKQEREAEQTKAAQAQRTYDEEGPKGLSLAFGGSNEKDTKI